MLRRTLQFTLLCASIAASHQAAAGLLFDFDALPSYGNNVQNYVNSVAGAGNVTVYGAHADKEYVGDKFVTKSGAVTNPGYLQYLTLGTSDGAKSPTDFAAKSTRQNDWFITNAGVDTNLNTAWGKNGNDKIVFVFKYPIFNLSFDWEVFPNWTCKDLEKCVPGSDNYPDFKLWAGTDKGSKLYDFGASYFPVSSPTVGGKTFLPQGLGHFSAAFASGVTRVEFVDWPVLIGIDNLDPRRVPEPGTLALLGLAAAAVAVARRGGASA
jgi:hypothetical protein